MKNIQHIKNRRSPWVVYMTINGKKRRKSFPSLQEANQYLRDFRRIKTEQGLESLFFCPKQRATYERLEGIAKARGFKNPSDFLDVIAGMPFPATRMPQIAAGTPKTITLSYREFLAQKTAMERSKWTIRGIKQYVGRFVRAFGNRPFDSITHSDIENFCLQGNVSPRSRRNLFSAVLSFLRFCKRRGYTSMNLDFDPHSFLPRELKKQKTVFSLAEVKALLALLQETSSLRRFIPFFAIQLFCGIRRAEVERMRWQYIHIAEKEIILPAEITKTGDEHIMRAPFLPETVFAWLAPFAKLANPQDKIPHPNTPDRALIVKRLGKWERNGCRHTFATMHVSLYGNPAKTAVLLRHHNQQRLWANYFAKLVPEQQAREYFSLTPSAERNPQ